MDSRKVISVGGDFHMLTVVANLENSSRSTGRKAHELFAWGDNSCGQLGTGDFQARATPTIITSQWDHQLSAVRSIAAGSAHSAAIFDLKNMARLFMFGVQAVWGNSGYGG